MDTIKLMMFYVYINIDWVINLRHKFLFTCFISRIPHSLYASILTIFHLETLVGTMMFIYVWTHIFLYKLLAKNIGSLDFLGCSLFFLLHYGIKMYFI